MNTRLQGALSAVMFSLALAAQAGPVAKVINNGADGDATFYSVLCADGTGGSMILYDPPYEICYQALGKKQACSKLLSIPEAAQKACK